MYSFCMGLAASGVQADFSASAESKPKGRSHDRARAEFDGCGHLLEVRSRQASFVPFAFLRGKQQLHQVGAYAEVFAGRWRSQSLAKSRTAFDSGIQHGAEHRDDVAADGALHDRVKLKTGDSVAEIDQGGAGILADDSMARTC
jgi:hypothetical protein